MRFIRSNVLGLVAIFIALSGVAVAVEKNSIRSRHIVKGGVQSSDVRDDTERKGGLVGRDIAPDALTGLDVDDSTLFNDDSLTGADIDESTLGEVPAATNATNAVNAVSAVSAASASTADTVDGIDSSALATGPAFITSRNFQSSAVEPGFADGIAIPGLGTLQLRCSALNPSRWTFRFRNDSSVSLDLDMYDGEIAHLPDATNPLPPFAADTQSIEPGLTGAAVELNNAAGEDSQETWYVVNDQAPANQSPQRYARFEILLSGSAASCFAAVLAIASR